METLWIDYEEALRGPTINGSIIALAGFHTDAQEILAINIENTMHNDACAMNIIYKGDRHFKICCDVTSEADGHVDGRTKTIRHYPIDEDGMPTCLREFKNVANDFVDLWMTFKGCDNV